MPPEAEAVVSEPSAANPAADPDGPFPIFEPAEHLDLHLRRFRGRLARFRLQRAAGSEDVTGALATIDRKLAAIEAELAARIAISEPALLPLEQLQRRFGLTDLGVQLLIGAA